MNDLDTLLAEAGGLRPEPSASLMERILADARLVSEERQPSAAAMPAPTVVGWRGWLGAMGGWQAIGGLAASVAVGIWIGAARPAGLPDLTDQVWGEGVSVAFGLDEDPLSLLEG